MENTNRKIIGGSSSSNIALDLFGPKDSSLSSSLSSSSTGFFGSVFPPPSTVLGREKSSTGIMGSVRKQDYGKHASPDNKTQSKDKSSIYQNQTAEPCYFSSSIYYGGQETYYPQTQETDSHPISKKDGAVDDPNGSNLNSDSRENWWKGSVYY